MYVIRSVNIWKGTVNAERYTHRFQPFSREGLEYFSYTIRNPILNQLKSMASLYKSPDAELACSPHLLPTENILVHQKRAAKILRKEWEVRIPDLYRLLLKNKSKGGGGVGGGVLYSDKHGLVQTLRPVVAIKFEMTV